MHAIHAHVGGMGRSRRTWRKGDLAKHGRKRTWEGVRAKKESDVSEKKEGSLVEWLLARAASRLQRGTATCLRCKGAGTIECTHCQGTGLLSEKSMRISSWKRAAEKVGALMTGSNATGPYQSGSWTKSNRCYHCQGTGRVVCPDCGGTGFRGRM
eukprot:scaffold810_cov355-Pavlova_lutheri.AAC.21